MPFMQNVPVIRPVATGFFQAIACAVGLVFITTFLPFYFKTWFVEPTGNIEMAPFFGVLLAVGIVLRSRLAHKGAILLFVFLALASLISLSGHPEKPGFWLVLILSIVLALLLVFSKKLKAYMR
jgi:hypothetical protein